MAVPWPASLEQLVNVEGFSDNVGSTVLRTDMDVGPAKVRRRTTRSVDTMDVSMICTKAQVQILKDFFDSDLNGGVEQFEFVHPISDEVTFFRFVTPPRFTPRGGLVFNVSMQWEVIP